MTPQAHLQVLRPVRTSYSKWEMVGRITPPGRLCVLRQVFTADTLIATMPLVVDLQPRRLYVILWRVVSIDLPLTAGWLLRCMYRAASHCPGIFWTWPDGTATRALVQLDLLQARGACRTYSVT